MVSLVEPSLRLMHSPRTQKFFLESLKFVNEVDCLLESPNSISKCESDSTGAVWFIHDKFGDPFAVFKPSDSEAGSEAGSKPARQGVLPGEGALHEFSVSFLSGNSTKVPLTCLVQINHPAVGQTPSFGSLQKYVPHQCQSWDMGPSAFSENDVHSVGVLDIRFLNTDRHGGNMLVSNQAGLIPIDHTYCLPHSLDETWYEWLQWPQAKKPFSSFEKLEILKFDILSSVWALRVLGIREECVFNFVLSNVILKEGVLRGMTLFEIGTLCSRINLDVPCAIEVLRDEVGSLFSLDCPDLVSELSAAVSCYLDEGRHLSGN